MKKLLFVLLTAFSAQIASAVSEVVVTFNKVTKVITFDFSGLEEGAYFDSYTFSNNGSLSFGTSYTALSGPNLLSNTLVDHNNEPVSNDAVAYFARKFESNAYTPLIALGFGNNTQSGSFTISGGSVSYDVSKILTQDDVDYLANFPFTSTYNDSFVGTGGFIMIGVTVPASTIPEPASFTVLTGLGALALVSARRHRRA
jgi:PEP-CTERM motif.